MIKIASEDDSLLGYSFRLLQRCYTALYARRQSVIFKTFCYSQMYTLCLILYVKCGKNFVSRW